MATPLTATGRVTIQYIENGRQHKLRQYVQISNPSGPAPYLLMHKDSSSATWTADVDALLAAVVPTMSNSASIASVLLEQRSGILWSLLDTYSPSGLSFPGAAYNPAVQATFVLRDTANKKIRFELMEGKDPAPFHSVSASGVSTALGHLANTFNDASDNPNDAAFWIKSRGDNFLASSPVVGITGTLNKKLRRARGLT